MTGQIYFAYAEAVNLLKIGYSAAPERRLVEVRLISPVTVELIGAIAGDYERGKEFHKKYKHLRSHGEWFHATESLIAEVQFECLKYLWEIACPSARERFREHLFCLKPPVEVAT